MLFHAPLQHPGVLQGLCTTQGLKNCFGKEYLKEGAWEPRVRLGSSRLMQSAPLYAEGKTQQQMLFSSVSPVSTGARNPYVTP